MPDFATGRHLAHNNAIWEADLSRGRLFRFAALQISTTVRCTRQKPADRHYLRNANLSPTPASNRKQERYALMA